MTQTTTQYARRTLTIQEAISLTGLSYGTIRNRIKDGTLEAFNTGGKKGTRVLIKMDSFDKFVNGIR